MAITLNLANSQFGVPFPAAYFRIVSVVITRDYGMHFLQIDVAGYATKPQNDQARDVEFRRYRSQLTEVEAMQGDTVLSKCYAWVMSQPDMEGASPA